MSRPIEFDTRPLTDPVDPAGGERLRHFSNSRSGAVWNDPSLGQQILMAAGLALVPTAIAVGVTLFVAPDGPAPQIGTAVAVVAFVGMLVVVSASSSTTVWVERLRLLRFAERNRLRFSVTANAPSYPSLLFSVGQRRRVRDNFHSHGPLLDIGSYSFYTTHFGERGTWHYWNFAVIRLGGRLPHLLLDARANNAIDDQLPVEVVRSLQEIPLGGELGRRYALYAPPGYGFDAYYVFTPDLLALLLDESQTMDVEIIDDLIFLYSRNGLRVADPETWRRLERIIDTMARLVGDRARTYQDHRALRTGQVPAPPGVFFTPPPVPQGPVPQVAPWGRRLWLRSRIGLTVLIVGVCIVVVSGILALV